MTPEVYLDVFIIDEMQNTKETIEKKHPEETQIELSSF